MDTITCKCRECQQIMSAVWQPGYAGREGLWMVTCENKRCEMRMYTFSERNYPVVDLSKYRKVKVEG